MLSPARQALRSAAILARWHGSVKPSLARSRRQVMATHEILNQPPPLADYNLFASDRALGEAVHRQGAGWAGAALADFGAKLGRAETIEWGFQANQSPPTLPALGPYSHRP